MEQFTDWFNARDYIEKIVDERCLEAIAYGENGLHEEEMTAALDEIVAEFRIVPIPGRMFIEDIDFLTNLCLPANDQIKAIFIDRLVRKFYPDLAPNQPDTVQTTGGIMASFV